MTLHEPKNFAEEVSTFYLKHNDQSLTYGIGCAWLGRNELTEAAIKEDVRVLKTAYELGFRYYDTSAAYGESEIILGLFVAAIPRESIFLATKSRIPEGITPKAAKQHVINSLERSMQRLKTSYIDLFQIHDIQSLKLVLASDGALEALLTAKKQGLIRYIGLATRELHLLQEVVEHGEINTILTYSDYTPLDQSAAALIQLANAKHTGVINGSPLSAGLLIGEDPRNIAIPANHAESATRKKSAIRFYDYCNENKIAILDAALQFPLRQSAIHMTLTGPARLEELTETVRALRRTTIPGSFWDEWNYRELKILEAEGGSKLC